MHSSGQSDSIMQLHQLYQIHGDLMLNPGGVGWLPMIIFVKVYYFIAIIYNDFKHRTKLEFYLQTNLSMRKSS